MAAVAAVMRTCFVCDGAVAGNRYFTLASCKTQASKQRLVDKLGQLVGEQYMVVISEDDIICRSCTTMLNSLDRLERELSSVRAVLLRFLERKYELEDGELMTDQVTLPPPPDPPAAVAHALQKAELQEPLTFQERKKRSEEAVAKTKIVADDSDGDLRSNVWMQCDKCRYTTPYTSFMIHHIHKHAEPQPPPPPPPPAVVEKAADSQPSQQQHQIQLEEGEEEEEMVAEGEGEEVLTNGDVVHAKTEREEEEGEGEGEGMVNGMVADDQQVEGEVGGEGDVVEMDLADENLCMVDENGVVQKVRQGEDGQFYLVCEDGEGAGEGEEGVAVQVMWDTAREGMQLNDNDDDNNH